jgi:uncharacterized protein (DUF433 family)
MPPKMVTSLKQVIENIDSYQEAVRGSRKIQDRVARVWSWYAMRDDGGAWKFAPSKFIGYRNATAERYLSESGTEGDFDGRATERVLSEWFSIPDQHSKLERQLIDELRAFLADFGKAPGARARINVPKADNPIIVRPTVDVEDLLGRISSDPEVCGGRPCINGTRMRVMDIVEAIAHGAKPEELLADFDYLTEEDITAALLYAARATDHRVVRTA